MLFKWEISPTPWWPIPTPLSRCLIFNSSRYNSFEDRIPVQMHLSDWIRILRHQDGIPTVTARRHDLSPAYHYGDVIMDAIASQIASLTIVYSIVYSDADQRKHQSSASLAFVWWIHRGPVNSPHKWPVTRKRFPFDDVIMQKAQNSTEIKSHISLSLVGIDPLYIY